MIRQPGRGKAHASVPDGASRSDPAQGADPLGMGSFRSWATLALRDPDAAGRRLQETVARVVASVGRGEASPDLVSEVTLRAWACLRSPNGWPGGKLVPWLWGVSRNVMLEWRRGEGRMPLDLLAGEPEAPPAWSRLEQEERCRVMARAFVRLTETLPPPSGAILWMQRIQLRSRSEIEAHLMLWRPEIGPESARRCIREAHHRLRVAWPDKDPRALWPQAFSKNNPWILTPPLFFVTTRMKGSRGDSSGPEGGLTLNTTRSLLNETSRCRQVSSSR